MAAMSSLPDTESIQQLLSCNELKMKRNSGWFKTGFDVKVPGHGKILRISGNLDFNVKDLNGTVIGTLHISTKWFERPTMKVTLCSQPPILIKIKGFWNRSLCLYEYGGDENEEPEIKLKKAGWTKLNILKKGHIIGSVKKSWGDYICTWPQNLEVRYKVALLGVCAFEHYTTEKR